MSTDSSLNVLLSVPGPLFRREYKNRSYSHPSSVALAEFGEGRLFWLSVKTRDDEDGILHESVLSLGSFKAHGDLIAALAAKKQVFDPIGAQFGDLYVTG